VVALVHAPGHAFVPSLVQRDAEHAGGGFRGLFGGEDPSCPVAVAVDEHEVVGSQSASLQHGLDVHVLQDEVPDLGGRRRSHVASVGARSTGCNEAEAGSVATLFGP
jgi:hypothetical protein